MSNPNHPECECCGEGATRVSELQELMTDETLHELARSMRWRAFIDPLSHRVLVADQNLLVPAVYTALTVDEALALSEEIAACPAGAALDMGDDLSLSGEELAVFGIELRHCVCILTGVS
jgi:hypothetical protein